MPIAKPPRTGNPVQRIMVFDTKSLVEQNGSNMLRVFANIIIAVIALWTLAAAMAAMLDITVYFPWVVPNTGEIPQHRLAAIRVGVLLTFAYFGFLHLFGKSIQLYPINFLTTFLFYLVLGGTIVFYRYQVPLSEYWLSAFWAFICAVAYFASRPLIRDYFRNKWDDH